ncbi:MAG: HDIG domain-containing protein [candidate division KSB1 bacterium]|nr:HDIG domain-containing protein [candidate division KSB1 bacterium]MDZ7272879.1 HDIG domain-containing protein [candidate division KSB1 bacterium]MDZ7284098.1 HDIG domain-containing protein [candidate division KSB1 bacterium]MDZ7297504.1 HDIG domain-containing protein [candidate division KSB1 bacterium]MDZ7305640.1 HDIG domain-containing protein [candidate division KSB1 bacterium]
MKQPPTKPFLRIRALPKIQLSAARWYRHRWQFLVMALFTTVCVLLFPQEATFRFADLREGDIYIGEPIIAPFTFPINKTPEEYERDKQAARESVYPIFVRRDSVAEARNTALAGFLNQLEGILASLAPDSVKAVQIRQLFDQQKNSISTDGLRFLLTGFTPRPAGNGKLLSFAAYRQELERILRDVYTIGLINLERSALPDHVRKVALRTGSDEIVEELDDLHHLGTVHNAVLQKLREIARISEPAINLGYQIVTSFVTPNLFFEQLETEARINEALARVPLARGSVLENEKIIESHEKITREHIQKLNSLAGALVERKMSEGPLARLLPTAGKLLMTVLSLTVLIVFLRYWRAAVYEDISRVILIALILLLVVFLAHAVRRMSESEFLIPYALAPMLLTIFFDARLAFVGTTALAILLGSLRGNEFAATFLCIIVGMASILSVRKVRSRTWIFKAFLFLGLAYILAASALAFLLHSPGSRLSGNILSGLLSAAVTPILTYGMMIIFEYLFDITTDATLLELSDLNRPLLRELAVRAPGTYHHSIVVGTLSEAAAEAIGANSLLARVGAYYHDIGKLEKPEYFVENQRGGKNPHDKLAPTMSRLIIINHVKRGIEIAESNGLPRELRDFIPQHHGTNLISYFYRKAQERNNESEIQETSFRYPGPKPQTKETGIVMLADGVEAAARSLREPSVSRIRALVSQIIAQRFTAGELDECPLTLRDLNQIKESFERTLTGIFHGRLQYPGGTEKSSETESEDSSDKPAGRSTESGTLAGEQSNGNEWPLEAEGNPPGREKPRRY